MFDLTGKVTLITGAVGNLGAATAKLFVALGARTVLVDRSEDRLRSAFPMLNDSSDHLLLGDADLTSTDSVARLVDAARQYFDRIDVAVNTVGGFRGGRRVHETDPTDWDFLFRTNLTTTLNVCRAVVPLMIARHSGRIINVASQTAIVGQPKLGAYSASKSAVMRLTETLAAELRDDGITANCVLPGTMDTPQNRQAMPKADTSKWVQPAEVAGLIAYLASDGSQVVSGTAIPIGRE